MKLKVLLACIAITILVSSCKSKVALDYSEMIVKKERALAPIIRETEDKAEKYFTNLVYDSIVVVSKNMEEKVQESLDEIKKTPAPDVAEGENFKKASIRYFEYIKSVYTSYRNYGEQTTDEGRDKEREKMLEIHSHQDDAIADMQGAQRKYAKANGFKIEGQK